MISERLIMELAPHQIPVVCRVALEWGRYLGSRYTAWNKGPQRILMTGNLAGVPQ